MYKKIKSFNGQFREEKILFSARESIFNFFTRQFWITLAIIIISTTSALLLSLFNQQFLGIIISITILLIYFFELGIRYYSNIFIITSRRILKFERTALFIINTKELKLENIKQTVASKQHPIQLILNHGDITIHGQDNIVHIFFHGLLYHDQVAKYISKIIDYITKNGHTDNLASFQPKHLRKKYGNPTHENIHNFTKKTKNSSSNNPNNN